MPETHQALVCSKCERKVFHVFKEVANPEVFVIRCPFCRTYQSLTELKDKQVTNK